MPEPSLASPRRRSIWQLATSPVRPLLRLLMRPAYRLLKHRLLEEFCLEMQRLEQRQKRLEGFAWDQEALARRLTRLEDLMLQALGKRPVSVDVNYLEVRSPAPPATPAESLVPAAPIKLAVETAPVEDDSADSWASLSPSEVLRLPRGYEVLNNKAP